MVSGPIRTDERARARCIRHVIDETKGFPIVIGLSSMDY
ncbi:protein of unknown function [Cyanobium sp. NIES-981]|nr:protein of unknown function [Cyanobium sp. NIES-981]